MQKILLFLIYLFMSFEVKSDDEKIYDKYGKYKGQLDDSRFFDPYGKYKGRIENNKKIFDSNGSLRGSISKN